MRGYLKAQFLHVVQKPVNFASLTDNFTLLFSKLFKLISNANTANIEQLFGPEKLSELSRNGPLVVKSLRPSTAWTSSECKWLNVDVGLARSMFVVLEKNTLLSLPLRGAGFPECALNLRLVISMFRSVSSPYVGLMTLPIGRMGSSE